MPSVEFKYRQYQIEKKLKQHVSDAERALDDRTGEVEANNRRLPLAVARVANAQEEDKELLNSPSESEAHQEEHYDQVNQLPSVKKKSRKGNGIMTDKKTKNIKQILENQN